MLVKNYVAGDSTRKNRFQTKADFRVEKKVSKSCSVFSPQGDLRATLQGKGWIICGELPYHSIATEILGPVSKLLQICQSFKRNQVDLVVALGQSNVF